MKRGEVATFDAGDVIYRKGDEIDCMYILVEGSVYFEAVTTTDHTLEITLEEGDYFGEASPTLGAPFTRDCADNSS